MNKKTLLSIIIALLMAQFSFAAQDKSAFDILDETLSVIKKNIIKTNFDLEIQEKSSQSPQKMTGEFLMNGQKFVLKVGDMEVYFDGKTQWVYMPAINEVSISNPSSKELAQTNPLALLSTYRSNSKAKFLQKKQDKYVIGLTPLNSKADFKSIQIEINAKSLSPISMIMLDKTGVKSKISMKQLVKGVKVNNKNFTFNPSLYKDIEINDLR